MVECKVATAAAACRDEIDRRAAQISTARPSDMSAMQVLVTDTDAFLATLSDERAVLKAFAWPDAKCGPPSGSAMQLAALCST